MTALQNLHRRFCIDASEGKHPSQTQRNMPVRMANRIAGTDCNPRHATRFFLSLPLTVNLRGEIFALRPYFLFVDSLNCV